MYSDTFLEIFFKFITSKIMKELCTIKLKEF